MIKERPILFKGEMVRPILNMKLGVWPPEAIDPIKPIKWNTRRVIKPQPDTSRWKPEVISKPKKWAVMPCLGPGHHIEENMWGLYDEADDISKVPYTGVKCPYGKPGDRLWVRETFKANEYRKPNDPTLKDHFSSRIAYKADGHTLQKDVHMDGWLLWLEEGWSKWRPSIHMPRWTSRINLEITNIRVERVQDISEADAMAEGVTLLRSLEGKGIVSIGAKYSPLQYVRPRQEDEQPADVLERAYKYIPHYAALWDSINAKRGYPWKDNPWVWVVEFKRVEG